MTNNWIREQHVFLTIQLFYPHRVLIMQAALRSHNYTMLWPNVNCCTRQTVRRKRWVHDFSCKCYVHMRYNLPLKKELWLLCILPEQTQHIVRLYTREIYITFVWCCWWIRLWMPVYISYCKNWCIFHVIFKHI